MITVLKHLPKQATVLLLGLAAACADNAPMAPAVPTETLTAALAPTSAAIGVVSAMEADEPVASNPGTLALVYPSGATTYSFTVNPTVSQTHQFGPHMIRFPKNTICDPAVTTYGPLTWLLPCTKLTTPITIKATVWTVNGRPQVDFNKALRFYRNSSLELPTIYLQDPWAASHNGRIDYCTFLSLSCLNEAISDLLLITNRDPGTGFLWRYIRHFSGYNVWA